MKALFVGKPLKALFPYEPLKKLFLEESLEELLLKNPPGGTPDETSLMAQMRIACYSKVKSTFLQNDKKANKTSVSECHKLLNKQSDINYKGISPSRIPEGTTSGATSFFFYQRVF